MFEIWCLRYGVCGVCCFVRGAVGGLYQERGFDRWFVGVVVADVKLGVNSYWSRKREQALPHTDSRSVSG